MGPYPLKEPELLEISKSKSRIFFAAKYEIILGHFVTETTLRAQAQGHPTAACSGRTGTKISNDSENSS